MDTTLLLTIIANDIRYNKEVRMLAESLIHSDASDEAKLALLEELIRVTEEGGEC